MMMREKWYWQSAKLLALMISLAGCQSDRHFAMSCMKERLSKGLLEMGL
jgi:hypothetical protein